MRVTVANVTLSRRSAAYPLGAVSIAAALCRAGVAVDLRDYLLRPGDLLDEENFRQFLDGSGDLVWICCGPDALPFIALCLEQAKASHPEKRFVLSERIPPLPKQSGPSGVAAELLERFPQMDAVAVGECDETAIDCASTFPDFDGVAGLVWRDGDRVRATPPRPRLETVPEIADRAEALLDFQAYRDLAGPEAPDVPRPIAASRGCVYSCTFCSVAPMWNRQQTRRPVAAVIEEIVRLAKRAGQRRFTFVDETFVLDRAWVLRFCDALRRVDLPEIRWACTGRVDLLDEELSSRMGAAGCERIELGIESGSDRVLSEIQKGFSAQDALRVVRQTSTRIPSVLCNFIWGFPFESARDLGETLLVMKALGSSPGVGVKLFFLMPLRPTSLFDVHYGFLRYDPFWHRCVPALPAAERALDLARAHPRLFSSFCHYDHPDLQEKLALLERWRMGPEATSNGLTFGWSDP